MPDALGFLSLTVLPYSWSLSYLSAPFSLDPSFAGSSLVVFFFLRCIYYYVHLGLWPLLLPSDRWLVTVSDPHWFLRFGECKFRDDKSTQASSAFYVGMDVSSYLAYIDSVCSMPGSTHGRTSVAALRAGPAVLDATQIRFEIAVGGRSVSNLD